MAEEVGGSSGILQDECVATRSGYDGRTAVLLEEETPLPVPPVLYILKPWGRRPWEDSFDGMWCDESSY